MRSMKKFVLCFSLSSVLLAISGCSKCGSSSAPTDAGASMKPVSQKAEYIAKADKICEAMDDKLVKEIESLPKPTTEEETLKWSIGMLNRSLDAQEAASKEMAAIEKPAEDAALLQQILESDASRRESARAFGKALESETAKSVMDEQQAQVKAAAKAVSDMATKYGFKFCFRVLEN